MVQALQPTCPDVRLRRSSRNWLRNAKLFGSWLTYSERNTKAGDSVTERRVSLVVNDRNMSGGKATKCRLQWLTWERGRKEPRD